MESNYPGEVYQNLGYWYNFMYITYVNSFYNQSQQSEILEDINEEIPLAINKVKPEK